MELQTSLPAYMGFSMQNAHRLNITEEQAKQLAALKSVIMPVAHPLKDGVITSELRMLDLYQSKGDIKEIEELINKASEFRIGFAEVKTDCRQKVKQLLTAEQWESIINVFTEEMAYELNSSLENISAIYNKDSQTASFGTEELQTEITTYEKLIQDMSLRNESYDSIIAKVKELEAMRKVMYSKILINY